MIKNLSVSRLQISCQFLNFQKFQWSFKSRRNVETTKVAVKNNYDDDPIKVIENSDEVEISEFTLTVADDATTLLVMLQGVAEERELDLPTVNCRCSKAVKSNEKCKN